MERAVVLTEDTEGAREFRLDANGSCGAADDLCSSPFASAATTPLVAAALRFSTLARSEAGAVLSTSRAVRIVEDESVRVVVNRFAGECWTGTGARRSSTGTSSSEMGLWR